MPHLTDTLLESLWPALQAPWDDKRALKKIVRDDGSRFFVIQFGWIIDRLNTVCGLGHWRIVDLDHAVAPTAGTFEATQHIFFELGNWHWSEDRGSQWECLAQSAAYGVYQAATPGEALKGALTNAMKKAIALLGPGLSLIQGLHDDDEPTAFVIVSCLIQSGATRQTAAQVLEFTGRGLDDTQHTWILHATGVQAEQLAALLHHSCTVQGLASGDHTHLQVTALHPLSVPAEIPVTEPLDSHSASAPSLNAPVSAEPPLAPSPTVASSPQPSAEASTSPAPSPSLCPPLILSAERTQKLQEAEERAAQHGLVIARLREHFAPDNAWTDTTVVEAYYSALVSLRLALTLPSDQFAARITVWSAYEKFINALVAYGWNSDTVLAPLLTHLPPDGNSDVTQLTATAYQQAAQVLVRQIQKPPAA